MDVLDRSPQLGFFPVTPPPANASPLDPATNAPVTGDFAQALALVPTEAPPTTTATVVAPVVVAPTPILPSDIPVAVEFDPTAVLTAFIQYRAPQLPTAEEVADPLPDANPSTFVTNVDESPLPNVAIPPVVIPSVIPIGLSQGLTIEPPSREVLTTTSIVEGDSHFGTPTTSFIINTLPAPTWVVPTRPTPQATTPAPVDVPQEAAPGDETNEPLTASPIVTPSFVTLTIPQPQPVAPLALPQVTPPQRPLPAASQIISTAKPVAEATIPSAAPAIAVAPAVPTVISDSSTATAPTVTSTDTASSVVSITNTAAPVVPAAPVTSPAPVSTEFHASESQAPIPPSFHTQPVETPVVATQTQIINMERTAPAVAPAPRGEATSLPQPIVNANSTPSAPSVPTQPAAAQRSTSIQAEPKEVHDTPAEAVPSTSVTPPGAFAPVTSVNQAPSNAVSVAPPVPTSSRAISPPAVATPQATPSTEDTAATSTAVVTNDPSPVIVPKATDSVAATETDDEASGKANGPRIAAVHNQKVPSTSKDGSDSGPLKPRSDLKTTESKPVREDSRTEHVVPTAARLVEPVMIAAPALDFGDPVPINETRQVVQRLGDAIGLAHETGQHLSIRVTPPQFGPIVVNVRMHDGMMSARVETHSAVAQQVLAENLPQLHESLSARGAIIDRIEVVPVENRVTERSAKVEEVATETAAKGWMSSETPGRQGYDPQDSSRRRPPRPQPIKPATEAAAIESVTSTRPVQLQELNVRV